MGDSLDEVWKALSDPTRRRILDLCRERPQTTGELAEAFPDLTRFAVMKHLGVLVSSGLIITRKTGRNRFNHLNAVPLRRIYERWVSRYESAWAGALLGLKRSVETEQRQMPLRAEQHEALEVSAVLAATPAEAWHRMFGAPAADWLGARPPKGVPVEAGSLWQVTAGAAEEGGVGGPLAGSLEVRVLECRPPSAIHLRAVRREAILVSIELQSQGAATRLTIAEQREQPQAAVPEEQGRLAAWLRSLAELAELFDNRDRGGTGRGAGQGADR